MSFDGWHWCYSYFCEEKCKRKYVNGVCCLKRRLLKPTLHICIYVKWLVQLTTRFHTLQNYFSILKTCTFLRFSSSCLLHSHSFSFCRFPFVAHFSFISVFLPSYFYVNSAITPNFVSTVRIEKLDVCIFYLFCFSGSTAQPGLRPPHCGDFYIAHS